MSTKVFASARILLHYPLPSDSSDLQGLEYVLVIEAVHGEVRYVKRTSNNQNVDVDDTFAVYTPAGDRVFAITEKQTAIVKFPFIANIDDMHKKTQEATREAVASTVRQFLLKFANTEIATKPPALSKPSLPSVGRLVILAEPKGAQVYLNDQFTGGTSEQEGKLLVGNLPVGTYALRVSLVGYKDWAQSVTVSPGEELRVEAKLVPTGPPSLTLKEVEDALRNGVPKSRVKALVEQYGVNFILSNEAEQRLRDAGADGELLLAVSKSKR